MGNAAGSPPDRGAGAEFEAAEGLRLARAAALERQVCARRCGPANLRSHRCHRWVLYSHRRGRKNGQGAGLEVGVEVGLEVGVDVGGGCSLDCGNTEKPSHCGPV